MATVVSSTGSSGRTVSATLCSANGWRRTSRDWFRCSRPRPTLRSCSGRYRWAAIRRSLSPR